MRRLIFCCLACWAVLAPPGLGWELAKGDGAAWTSTEDASYRLTLDCRRGQDFLGLNLFDKSGRGDGMQDIRGVMLWIAAPDGRTDKWSVEVVQEGPAISGRVAFSAQTLDFFGNAQSLEVTSYPGNQVLMRSDMSGTGAARLAFRERCRI